MVSLPVPFGLLVAQQSLERVQLMQLQLATGLTKEQNFPFRDQLLTQSSMETIQCNSSRQLEVKGNE